MANRYDTNLKLQAIADAIGDSQSSGLISALEDIADAVAGGGGGGSSAAGLVSDNFSDTATYDIGDYCIHNNTLYVCINAITTPGTWDLSDWQATNAGIELSSLNSALEYHKGDVIITNPVGTVGVSISGSRVEFYLPLNKPISSDVTSATLVSADTQLYIWTGTSALNMGSSVQSVTINVDRQSLDFVFNQSSYTPTETGKYYIITGRIKVSLS